MILDAVPYRDSLSDSDAKKRALVAFTDLLERKLGVKIVKDLEEIPFSRPDLAEPLKTAALLKKYGVIKSFSATTQFPDLPPVKDWYAKINDPTSHHVGGTSWDDDASAMYAAFSEALERYIWMTQDDYFVNPTMATVSEIAKKGLYIAPQNFVGYSEERRKKSPELMLREDAEYLWIQGTSLTQGGRVYLPAQTVCGIRRKWPGGKNEPLIRPQITNGLATWPTRAGAQLAGALETIEREAYMIMWLNQMTMPRYTLMSLRALSPSLSRAIATCERYLFKIHVMQMPTDAPTHAVAVVMEDVNGNAPRFTLGLRAHTSLPIAVEKAMAEALRAQHIHKAWVMRGNSWDMNTPIEKIDHHGRLHYWGVPEHAKLLEFLIKGPEVTVEKKPWDNDSREEHLQRIVQWCREKNFDCISVPLTTSLKNPTPLHVEMMVIPQLHPTYLHESVQLLGGTRLQDVPKALGYTPRQKPFADRPHPFL
jgi:ribosomal protein S12 methylthiotransferase accessory factor